MTSLFLIRTKSVRRYPRHIPCPFKRGAFMTQYTNAYAGVALCTASSTDDATTYSTRAEAQAVIEKCDCMATFVVVEFREVSR